MSSDLDNWAKKYEDLLTVMKLLQQWQSITHAHLCLIWKKKK